MPRAYIDEERELAEEIKDHWRRRCRRLYKGLLAGGHRRTEKGCYRNMGHGAHPVEWQVTGQAERDCSLLSLMRGGFQLGNGYQQGRPLGCSL